jgi:hypothetical protein
MDLDILKFELFKDKLAILVNAVYRWHQEQKNNEIQIKYYVFGFLKKQVIFNLQLE